MAYVVQLKDFEGPLDLLLHLISRAKVNIRDIFVSEITEQYLQSIEDLSGLDMDAASEFLQMAATLLEIKSRALLPKPPKTEDEEDPQEVLMRRLEEYKRIKEAGKTLRIYEAEAQEMVTRLPLEMVTEARIELSQMSLESLQAAFLNVLLRAERSDAAVSPMRQIERDTFTIGECMLRIQRRVIVQRRMRFDELFPADATRSEIITIFLAMLELLKANRITLQQEDIYAPIMIERGKETAADDADGTDFGGFASGEPVAVQALIEMLGVTAQEFEPVLQGLALRYDEDRGVRLMRFDDSLQLCTRPQYMDLIEKVLQPVRKQTLTQAALETLAVVAYRQPVTRMEIEQIRGVQCDRAVATLLHHGLIAEVGRKESIGRPILYGTTEKFLQHFALTSLEALPRLAQVKVDEELTDFGGV